MFPCAPIPTFSTSIHIFQNAAQLRRIEYSPGFSQRFAELREFPFLGPDRSELRASLRGLLVEGYIAFYMVEVDRIVIVRVIDGRKDIEQELSK